MLSDDMLVEVKSDVKEVKAMVIDLVKQGAVHNQVLSEHEKRSTQLETRLSPIEADYSFRHRLFSIAIAALAASGSIIAILEYVKHLS